MNQQIDSCQHDPRRHTAVTASCVVDRQTAASVTTQQRRLNNENS